MKAIHYTLSYVISCCLVIFCLFAAISMPTFTPSFYQYEYQKNRVYDEIHIEKSELDKVTLHLIDYLKGNADELQSDAVIDGQNKPFFNDKEIAHMIDVEKLFAQGFIARNVAVFTILISVVLLIKLNKKWKEILATTNIRTIIVFSIVVAVLLGIVAIDFQKAFTTFHHIFFSNDLWLLDPRTDLLINIVPLPFFIDIASAIVCLFVLFVGVIFAVSCIYLKNSRNRKEICGDKK